MAEKRESNIGNVSVKVSVDVSDAITGLKAVQREAKEATHALKELESTKAEEKARAKWDAGYRVIVAGGDTLDYLKIEKELREYFPKPSTYSSSDYSDPRKTIIVYPSEHQKDEVFKSKSYCNLIEDGAVLINIKNLRVILGALF